MSLKSGDRRQFSHKYTAAARSTLTSCYETVTKRLGVCPEPVLENDRIFTRKLRKKRTNRQRQKGKKKRRHKETNKETQKGRNAETQKRRKEGEAFPHLSELPQRRLSPRLPQRRLCKPHRRLRSALLQARALLREARFDLPHLQISRRSVAGQSNLSV